MPNEFGLVKFMNQYKCKLVKTQTELLVWSNPNLSNTRSVVQRHYFPHDISGQIQTSQTGSRPYSDTSLSDLSVSFSGYLVKLLRRLFI